MDMLPTLCTAMKRAGGDCLVLRTGESPHVLIGDRSQNVARAVLSLNALEALVSQIFSEGGRRMLADIGTVEEQVSVHDGNFTLMARAERKADQVTIELREKQSDPLVPDAETEPLPAAAQQWFEVPVTADTDGDSAFDAVPSFATTAAAPLSASDVSEPETAAPVHEIALPAPTSAGESDARYEELFLQVPAVSTPAEPEAPGDLEAPSAIQTDAPDVPRTATWSFSTAPSAAEPFAVQAQSEESVLTPSHDLEFVEPPSSPGTPADTHATSLTGWAARAASRGATAVYLRAGVVPMARIDDRLTPLNTEPLEGWRFDELLTEFSGARANGWEPGAHGEWTQRIGTIGQVSCWSFTDDEGAGLMMRLRLFAPTRSLYKMIPRRVRAACDGDGLIVVSAATTADLGAIAAAVADLAGRRRGGYVIALRPAGAPRHDISGAFVSQRELSGGDGDVAAAIRSAASESPDVLLVAPPPSEGAMREVVNAADGGRLVIFAVLAPTSMQALRAIVGRASAGGDAQTRLALATSFRVAFAYRVMQRLGGGRTFARDLVVGTSEISAMLASSDFPGIARVQREGAMSMTTVDDSLAHAVRRGHLSLRQAAAQAVDKRYLVSLVRAGRRAQARAAVEPSGTASSDALEPVSSSRRGGDATRWS